MKKIVLTLVVCQFIVTGCKGSMDAAQEKTVDNFGVTVKVNRAGMLYTVPLEKVTPVLAFRGNVPPLDAPGYVSAAEAAGYLADDDRVIGVNRGGVTRAYPEKILRWHLTVTDLFDGEPILVTYDPLARMGAAYRNRVLDKTLRFAASDKVYNGNPVLMDADTKSNWSQFTGESIVGRLAGQRLEEVPLFNVSWGEWKKAYPETKVLSIETGHRREYDRNLYADFHVNDFVPFDVEHSSSQLKNKEEIYGISIGGAARAYRASLLSPGTEISDNLEGVKISITVDGNGLVSAQGEDGSEIIIRRMFWYAWAAFHPGTTLYEKRG